MDNQEEICYTKYKEVVAVPKPNELELEKLKKWAEDTWKSGWAENPDYEAAAKLPLGQGIPFDGPRVGLPPPPPRRRSGAPPK